MIRQKARLIFFACSMFCSVFSFAKAEEEPKTISVDNGTKKAETIDTAKAKDPAQSGISVIGGISIAYDVYSYDKYTIVEPKVVIGYRYKFIRMGVGMNFIYAKGQDLTYVQNTSSESIDVSKIFFLPIGTNLHCDFGKKKVKPSIEMELGYPICFTPAKNLGLQSNSYNKGIGKVYAQFNPGISIKPGNKIMVNLAATYSVLFLEFIPVDSHAKPLRNVLMPLGLALSIIY